MSQRWTPIVALVAAVVLTVTGCAPKQEEQPAGTSTDTTLSMGDVPQTEAPTPDPGAISQVEPTPAPEAAPPAAKPKPRPAPTPRPEAKPAEAPGVVVPAGTKVNVTLDAALTTKTATAGDTFTATVAEDVVVDGKVVFPAGSTVNGHIVEAVRPGKASGKGRLVLGYDSITAGGRSYSIDTVGAPIESKSGTGGDVTKIVGGAAAGAILGKVIGGSSSDAAKGAAAGAAAGTAATLLTRGPEAEVKAGTTLAVALDRSVTVKP